MKILGVFQEKYSFRQMKFETRLTTLSDNACDHFIVSKLSLTFELSKK